jgi:ligand-binding SRPBCC domain-containing protein
MTRNLKPKVTVVSRVEAPPSEVWAQVSGFDGVNREMSPLMRMTPPAAARLDDAAGGEILPIKLKGPLDLPLGTYPLRLLNIETEVGFLEQTQMLPYLLWQHERKLSAEEGGTVVADSLGWRWRAHRLDAIFATIVRRFFIHRHRQLRSDFGEL